MRATIEANPKPIDNDDFIANVATSSAIITVAIEGSRRRKIIKSMWATVGY